jgi:hypothetical protein
MAGSWLQVETRPVGRVKHGDNTVTLLAQRISLRAPLGRGALLWMRPSAIVLERGAEPEQRLPVRNLTLQLQLGLLLLAVAVIAIAWWASRRDR